MQRHRLAALRQSVDVLHKRRVDGDEEADEFREY
jgi:hypothetical protein